MNLNFNTARAPNIKHDSPEVSKDVCYFAERVIHMLDVKINQLRIAMYKSDNLPSKEYVYDKNTSIRMGSRSNTGSNSGSCNYRLADL